MVGNWIPLSAVSGFMLWSLRSGLSMKVPSKRVALAMLTARNAATTRVQNSLARDDLKIV